MGERIYNCPTNLLDISNSIGLSLTKVVALLEVSEEEG